VLALGLLAAFVVAVRAVRRGEREAWLVVWAVAAALLLVLVYAITPNTASGFEGNPVLVFYSARYLVPAALPAVAALGWLATRLGRWGLGFDALALAAVGDGLRRSFDFPAGDLVLGIAGVALLAAAAVALARVLRGAEPPHHTRRVRLGGAAAALALLALLTGYAVERSYSRDRFVGRDATIDRFLAETRDGDRVGITGSWSVTPPSPVHAMFGDRLRNEVDYVGEFSEGVNKPYATAAPFRAALRRGRYDWLMIGRGVRPEPTTPAMTWAAAAGYRLVAQTPRLALYRAP
jgi:hypothetical protein